MPKDEADPEDPLELCAEFIPCDAETDAAQAEAFVEEFALMGYSEEFLWRLFKDPFYEGTHRLLRVHGEEWVRERIEAVRVQWKRVGG